MALDIPRIITYLTKHPTRVWTDNLRPEGWEELEAAGLSVRRMRGMPVDEYGMGRCVVSKPVK